MSGGRPALPPRPEGRPSPRELLGVLADQVGESSAALLCADVLDADDPAAQAATVRFLGGRAGESVLAGTGGWKAYWARTWGARGLLYVWDDRVAPVVLSRLSDEAWRVAEMCMKVATLRELPGADAAVRLSTHELPLVRAVAMRLLGAAGDTEHVAAAMDGLGDPDPLVRRAASRAVRRLETRLDVTLPT